MNKKLLDKFENNKKHKYIEIINPVPLNGSVNNYFHFMYGVLLPLVLLDYKLKQYDVTYIFDFLFGPLDKIIFSLPIDIKIKHYIKNYEELNIHKVVLKPMDIG
jgi:hypothetical protein